MNMSSNFLIICLLLTWSIGIQAYTTTISQQSPDNSTALHSIDNSSAECKELSEIDKNALVIYVSSQQPLYVLSPYQYDLDTLTEPQISLHDLGTLTKSQISHCFKKVVVLNTQTGELVPFVAEEDFSGDSTNKDNMLDYTQWQIGIGTESGAVEEMAIYAKTLKNLAKALKTDDPEQDVNFWPWRVPYSGLSKNLLAWLIELEPDALVVLTAGSRRGVSSLEELSTTRFTSWEDRYSLKINNQIFTDDEEQVPLTRLFGGHSLFFEIRWRDENLFEINTPLEDAEQLSLPLWFLPNSELKSEITLMPKETKALKAPLQLIELNTQAGELTFAVRQENITPTVLYLDNAMVDWATHCPIEKEKAQIWINYLVNGAQLVCPYFDSQNKIKIELSGDGISIDTRQLLLSFDFMLDDFHTDSTDWQIKGALSNLQSDDIGVWKILASDLSFEQCSLTFEPISPYATLAFSSTPVEIPDEICQRLYKQKYSTDMLGLKLWTKGQKEEIAHSFEIKVVPAPRLLQTHLPKDSLWREMRWLLNNELECQIKEGGYFKCDGENNISFLDLLGGQITLQGFNETISIPQKLANNQALLAIYCGDLPRLFPLSHRNIIKGTADNPYAVLDRRTNITRYFNRIYDDKPLWLLTAPPIKDDIIIIGFDKRRDHLFTHGIPVSPQQNRPPVCKNYTYYKLATSDKVVESECTIVPPPKPDTVHINWVFVNTQGEWRGVWDYRARQLAKPLADFLRSINQEMTFHTWFLDVNDAHKINLDEYSSTTVNSETDNRKIFNKLIQPIQNMRSQSRYANFSQQVPQVLSALAEKQQWQEGGRYLTILFAHRLSIADLEQQINRLSLQKPLVILSRRLPKRSQREAWAEQGIDFIRFTSSNRWYDELVEYLKAWNTGD
ncbi:hypothetical protein [Candidatus Parabeggiatoa sp. HSG14]|uniref:hypothetical protein n=1 Tax=Candidatus Parabeggiatoa sp. HSG14 TaxID=3055593 RepID=UPI0025A8DFDA|nr:hypothetical protein [Thiotrichales bacterium HSG14]